MAQLTEALCHKSKGCDFDSSMKSLKFFIDFIIPCDSGVGLASISKENHEYLLGRL